MGSNIYVFTTNSIVLSEWAGRIWGCYSGGGGIRVATSASRFWVKYTIQSRCFKPLWNLMALRLFTTPWARSLEGY